jgi:hypothetical protein
MPASDVHLQERREQFLKERGAKFEGATEESAPVQKAAVNVKPSAGSVSSLKGKFESA